MAILASDLSSPVPCVWLYDILYLVLWLCCGSRLKIALAILASILSCIWSDYIMSRYVWLQELARMLKVSFLLLLFAYRKFSFWTPKQHSPRLAWSIAILMLKLQDFKPLIGNHEQEVHTRDRSRPGSPPPSVSRFIFVGTKERGEGRAWGLG